ncbi:MAG: hypothetical protein QM722_07250 [Piscinibacter sp.]
MSLPAIPTKTARGQEALRRRTGDLGQRHRTILFLVDGRRPLSEVLSLAHQAGAATSHFEDLVRMGFVELPAEAPASSAPESEQPELSSSVAQLTELEVQVPADEPPIEPEPAPAAPLPQAVPAAKAVPRAPEPPPLPRPPSPPPARPVRRVVAMPPPEPAPVEPPAAAAARFDPAAELPRRPFLPPSQTPPVAAPPPAVPLEDQPVLEQARAQLLESLRCDPQPAAGRLTDRVRAAQGSSALVDVVWTMERGLHHHQRSHRGLLALQRARELLGLGNTLVDEDSTPGRLDDEDW